MISRGMIVRGTDGDLGTVAEVVADAGIDVFRGIVLAHGFLFTKQGFIPADKIARVEQNSVYVGLTKSEAEQLSSPEAGGQASGRQVIERRDNLL